MQPVVSVQSLPRQLQLGVSARGQYGFWLLRSCTQCGPIVAHVKPLYVLICLVGILPPSVTTPLFIATERFDPSDGERWQKYCRWAKIPDLVEIVSLDCLLCPRLINEPHGEDWRHVVNEDFRLDYFLHLDYLMQQIEEVVRRNILGVYRNPETHVESPPASGDFRFVGYDCIEEATQISALNDCGGFPDVFANDELNQFGLIQEFDRASEVRRLLAERHPNEHHAQCELYAIWRLHEAAEAAKRL